MSLVNFKIEQRGRGADREGNAREKRRILTAEVQTEGLKPRRALIPKRYATRFMEAIELRADEGDEPFAVNNVFVKVGEHGATLVDPNEVPRSAGGWKDEVSENGATPRRGRRRTEQPAEAA